jgi:cell division protease FtsH
VTFQAPTSERYRYSAKYLRVASFGALGGRAAEEIVGAAVLHRHET